MIAAGIDLGGTKIETQIFDPVWGCVKRRRIETPQSYAGLLQTLIGEIAWADGVAGTPLPVGIGVAGLINTETGLVYATNLAAMGRPLRDDIETTLGRKISFINDCRALALSEATFGAGRGKNPVAALILGTGVGGGVAMDGRLVPGFTGVGGEFGHVTLSAHLINLYALPVLRCGCGRMGCTETLISGPGLMRIAERFTGEAMSPETLVKARPVNTMAAQAWRVWCELLAELLATIVFMHDPAVIVIGGGMSRISGLVEDLSAALQRAQLPGFSIPPLVLAEGGDASGARGAAYAALQEHGHG